MGSRKNTWKRNISTLDQIAEDLYKGKNEEKYYKTIEMLYELGINKLTLGDIRTFIMQQMGISARFNDDYLFAYIMNPENREKLMRYADSKIQYDTMENDWNHGITGLDFDDRYY